MPILNSLLTARRVESQVEQLSPSVDTALVLPSAANMLGKLWTIVNSGTGNAVILVQSSTGALLGVVNPGCSGQVTPLIDSPTLASHWQLVGQWKEYASNSNATNASTDTTSFATGQAGSNIPNGAVGTSYTRTVQYLTSIQKTDRFVLEVSTNGSQWLPIADRFGPRIAQGTNNYGGQVVAISATQVNVEFGAGGVQPNNGTYASNSSTSWASFTAFFWRLAKYAN